MVAFAQVAELQRQVALGCQPGTAMLLERLAAPPCQQGEPGAQQPKGAQDRVPAGAFGEPGGSPARTAAQLGHTDGVAGPLPQGVILQVCHMRKQSEGSAAVHSESFDTNDHGLHGSKFAVVFLMCHGLDGA